MTRGGPQIQFTINGVNYPIARSENGYEFGVTGVGESLQKTWNNWQGGAGYTFDSGPNDTYYYGEYCDTTSIGRIRHHPLATAAALRAGNATTGFRYYFEIVHSGGTKFMGIVDGDYILVYSYDGSTVHLETQVANAVFGRPVFWGGKWYLPAGSAVNARRMDTVSNPPVAGDFISAGWEAAHMCTFQQGGVAKVVRAWQDNVTYISATKPFSIDTSDDPTDISVWEDGGDVGDTSTAITDLCEAQGLLYVAKEDNLYEYDETGNARPIIPFMSRSSAHSDNGKYTCSFGDMILYPTDSGLWRYRIGGDADIVGLDGNPSYTNAPGAGLIPSIRQIPYGGIASGRFVYQMYGNKILAFIPNEDAEDGFEVHFMYDLGFPVHGLIVDSADKLWAGIGVSPQDRPYIFQLGEDSGFEDTARGDTVNATLVLSGTNFDKPGIKKQLRSFRILVTSDNAVDIGVAVIRDFGVADSIGSVTSTGLTVIPFTPGTNDEADIVHVKLTMVNGATRKTQEIHELTLDTKRPYIYRVLIPADNDVLAPYGLEEEQVWQNLGRLLDMGFVEVEHFDQSVSAGNATGWQGEVKSVTHTTYRGSDGAYGRAIELMIHRYTTD